MSAHSVKKTLAKGTASEELNVAVVAHTAFGFVNPITIAENKKVRTLTAANHRVGTCPSHPPKSTAAPAFIAKAMQIPK
jgi:hypothetical protein